MSIEQVRLQQAKQRVEIIRWILLITLDIARPTGAPVSMLLSVVRAEYPDATANEIHRELDYLESRDLIKIDTDPIGNKTPKIDRYGIDVVGYTVDCEPGIARPKVAG